MADTVGDGQVSPHAPSILAVVLELVVKDVRSDVERGLREGAELTKKEVGIVLFEGEWAVTVKGRCRRPGADGRRDWPLCSIGLGAGHYAWGIGRRGEHASRLIRTIKGVRAIVTARELVLVLVIVIIDRAEL